MKKKILFISPSLCQGGIEHSLIMMLTLLDEAKYDMTVFLYGNDMTLLPLVPSYVRVVTDSNPPHYFRSPKAVAYQLCNRVCSKFGLRKLGNELNRHLNQYIHEQKVSHPARDIFQNEKFDVVVSNAIGRSTEITLRFRDARHYVFYHASIDMHHDMLEKVFPMYDGIIAVSAGVKDMLYANYPHVRDKVRVIENYVNAQDILEKAQQPAEIDKSRLILCTCGRLSEEKGFDLAVESARLLKDRGLDFIWYFVGDGNERKKIDGLIERHSLKDSIIITGYLDNPFPYISACDIYVQPSYHESYGRTIKEAIILGKPVVSTDTVGGRTILDNKNYGELSEVSSESLAEQILIAKAKKAEGKYSDYDIAQNEQEKITYISQLDEMLNG